MLTKYKILSFLSVLFTRQFELPDSSQITNDMLVKFPIFDANPVFQNIPEIFPPEIPRIILLNQKKNVILELAKAQINLRQIYSPPVDPDTCFPEFLKLLLRINSYLAEFSNVKFIRTGFVVQLFYEMGKSVNQHLTNYFLGDKKPFGDKPISELHINALHKLSLKDGMQINRWLRFRPLRSAPPKQLDWALMVEIDINTLQEESYDKDLNFISSFFQNAFDHTKNDIDILNNPYFIP